MNTIVNFSKNLKLLMRVQGWTTGKLAKSSGVGEGTIRNILKEKNKTVTLKTAYRLCVALKTTITAMCAPPSC